MTARLPEQKVAQQTTLPKRIPRCVQHLQTVTNCFERAAIDPALPYVKKVRTFGAVALQEFFSFAVLSPLVTGAIVYLNNGAPGQDKMTWYQYGLIGGLSLLISPLMVQGIVDSFSNDENWRQYFVQKGGKLVRDGRGFLIPDLERWRSKTAIVTDALLKGGLVRTAKVVTALFPQKISALENIPTDMIPKTVGEWVAFLTELVADAAIYLAYFGIDALNDRKTGASAEWDLALVVTVISVLAYCFTAPEIGRKYEKYKATWIRQVFSLFKNPAVMLAGSGLLPDGVSLAFITAFSVGLWAWARYGFRGDLENV